MTRNRGPPDLFGFDDPAAPSGPGMMDIALHFHRETGKAWLLSEDGEERSAQWLAKSLAIRGEGREAGVWTLPEWKARELGWA
jgi:hypothetical protein